MENKTQNDFNTHFVLANRYIQTVIGLQQDCKQFTRLIETSTIQLNFELSIIKKNLFKSKHQ